MSRRILFSVLAVAVLAGAKKFPEALPKVKLARLSQ
jgi:hypothetical protein